MDLDFLEIGTSDFEALAIDSGPETIGMSVEPVGEYLESLPSRPGLIKVRAAVSDRSGTGHVFRLSPHKIREFGLPRDVRGCNTLGEPHPTILKILERRLGSREAAIMQFRREEVEVLEPVALLRRHAVRSVDLLKIDTEGHDCRILNAYMDGVPRGLMPRRLRFESNSLTPPAEIESTIARLRNEHGFLVDEEATLRSRSRPGYEETYMYRAA